MKPLSSADVLALKYLGNSFIPNHLKGRLTGKDWERVETLAKKRGKYDEEVVALARRLSETHSIKKSQRQTKGKIKETRSSETTRRRKVSGMRKVRAAAKASSEVPF